jgi:ABC-type Fe3+ transport system permease subunit
MRRSISIGTGAVVAAVCTHGMVFSAMNWNQPLPISTYRGFFQHVLLATERLWSYAHGWQPMSHIDDFGLFYAHTVHLICPLIGFALFWIVSRQKVGIELWKPLAIALLLTVPPSLIALAPFYALGLREPWVDVVRTLLIVLLMVWSVGAIRISKPHAPTTESLATA